jgi:nucleoside-diphosphate-sugar epimerase
MTVAGDATTDVGALGGRPVLVTGAGGFVGSAVVRRLLELGAEVRALLGPGDREPPWRDRAARLERADIADRGRLAGLVAGVDAVYHLAGPPSVAASFDHPADALRVHAVGTAGLLELCVAGGVRDLVYVSSAEVYAADDGADRRIGEDAPRQPRSPYGVAKLAAELVLAVCADRGPRVSIVRPFSLYGPGAPSSSLLASLIAMLRQGQPLAVADPRPVRDYCFVDDAAELIVACAIRRGPSARAYNAASGRGVSVAELATALLRVAGRDDPVVSQRAADRPPAALTLRLVGDPTRARDELGFAAATSLEVGLARTLHGHREHGEGAWTSVLS